MEIKKVGIMIVAMIMIVGLCSGVSHADKSTVTIEAPEQAASGSEVTVKIHVTHSGNSYFHYTNWVKVLVNGQQAASWEYSAGNRPEGEKFTKEINVKVAGPTEIVAEANCNLHGSQGPATKMIAVQQ